MRVCDHTFYVKPYPDYSPSLHYLLFFVASLFRNRLRNAVTWLRFHPPIKESYDALGWGRVSFPTLHSLQWLHVQGLSTFRYSYPSMSVLRFPFKPVCWATPVTPQGILYSRFLLYPTYPAFAVTAFSTVSNFRLVHSGFLSVVSHILAIDSFRTSGLPLTATSGSLLPYRCVATGVYSECNSRLRRAVSGNVILHSVSFQRSLKGSVSGRYPFIPLLGISVGEGSASPLLLPPFRRLAQLKFVCSNVSLHGGIRPCSTGWTCLRHGFR